MTSPSKPILIVGSGVGGLVLANSLKNRSIPFRIFERDPALDFRPQGYRFHLRSPGPEALVSCLSPQKAEKLRLTSPCQRARENGRVCNVRTGEPDDELVKLVSKTHADQRPMNVDRSILRKVLSEGLDIEFGKQYESFKILDGGVSVSFADGCSVEGSLLVGADGVKSRVREQLLSGYTLLDTEGRWIWGKSLLTPQLRSKLSESTLNGILGGQDRSSPGTPITLLAESIVFDKSPDNPYRDILPKDYIYWVLQFAKTTVKIDDEKFFSLDSNGAADLAQYLTEEWIEEIRAIIGHFTPGFVAAQAVTTGDPIIPTFDGQGRVTLLGDAIHSMPPTAGAGASSAIQDAKWLAEAIEEGMTSETLRDYEEKMRRNGSDAIASSEFMSKKMYGARNFVEMKRVLPQH